MRKRKFTSTRFTIKMAAVATPVLLPLLALANPAEGRSGSQATAHRPVANTAGVVDPASAAVTTLLPVVGKVTLPDGKPAANTLIYITWRQNDGKQQFHKCAADANGKFETTVRPIGNGNVRITSTLVVTALLPGKGMAWTQSGAVNTNLAKLQIGLMPVTTLEGRLVHTDGTPNANAEVCLQALMPRSPVRNGVIPPVEKVVRAAANGAARQMQMRANNFQIMPLLPPDALAAQFRATTDANGKFTLYGVPRETAIALKTGGKMAMAAASANAFAVQNRERQSAGMFVVSPMLRVKVRVVDLLTHQPIPQTHVAITADDPAQNVALIQQVGMMNFNALRTDAKGELTSPGLLPGDYRINVSGCVKTVHLEPGQNIAPVEIAVRQGVLKGRLLDADGKPVADGDLRISAEGMGNGQFFGFSGNNFEMLAAQLGTQPDVAFFALQSRLNATAGFNSALPSVTVRVGNDGTFMIPNMPWGSPHIRLWAAKGNDLAEWSGPANKLDANLTLRMRRNALVTVSGRLVDPERRPFANVTCKALHWLPSPRITWFATARDIKTDADGNFKVDGLERGESFSLITLGQQVNNNVVLVDNAIVSSDTNTSSLVLNGGVQNALQTLGGSATMGRQIIPIRQDFESPRFMTCATGDGQSLGEVMVHPQDTPDEVLQSYEGSPGDEQTSLPGVVLAPSAADVQAAQAALARFDSALKSGDVNALTELTSHVSPGWSHNRQAFLQHVSLGGRMDADANASSTQALAFVPRQAIASLLKMAPEEANAKRAERLAETPQSNSEWVFLAHPGENSVVLAGILHREEGAWRVVANPIFATPEAMRVVSGTGTPAAGAWGKTMTAMPLELQSDAQQTGERYLQAWLNSDREQMRRLTSPNASLPAGNIARFRHALEHRADDGVCPLASEEKIALQPVGDLNLWDQSWLRQLAGGNGSINGNGMSVFFTENGDRVSGATLTAAATSGPKPVEEKLAPGNDTAIFRYTAQRRDFLMVLTRNNRHWQMLEPALPL